MCHCLKPLYLVCFLSSLLIGLWTGHGFATDRSVANEVSQTTMAPTAEATQRLQQGLERYQSGDLPGAIAQWQIALSLTAGRSSPMRVMLLKNLVRTEQQVGAIAPAIAHLEQLIADYRQTGNTVQAGRMQTEQAQAYSTLGQQRHAIALLCNDNPDRADDTCTTDSALAIARHKADTTGEIAALGSLGNAYRLRGDYDRALQYLQTALKLATQIQSQSQRFAALNGLGNTYASLAKRDDRRRQYAQQSADEAAAQAFAQRTRRYNRQAIELFETSLTIAHAQNDAVNELRSLLNLIVPLRRNEGRGEKAEGRRQKVEGKSGQENIADLLLTANNQKLAGSLTQNSKLRTQNFPPLTSHASRLTSFIALQQAQALLTRLPASREKAYAAIRLSTLMQLMIEQTDLDRDPATHCLATDGLKTDGLKSDGLKTNGLKTDGQATDELETNGLKADVPLSVMTLLQQAIAIAQKIGDSQAEAFALGRLGHVYECRQNYKQALALTQQAQLAAANHESRYLWEWQAGRLLQLQHKSVAAIAAYAVAAKTLQTIRGDLAIASRDFQFDFRDTVEPVYRELTALYLDQATKGQPAQRGQKNSEIMPELASAPTIALALETIDSLRLAELQNYLGDDCTLNAIATPVTVVEQKTAVLSSIMLGDRVAVILTLPTPNHQFHSQVQWLPASAQTVRTTVNTLRRQLEKRSDLANAYQKTSRQVYNWLIEPFAQDLQTAQIETLVFIQDGILRSLPMATLYDGNQFLIEQYAIASTLSLNLVEPTPLDRRSLRVLGFGLTQSSVVEGPTFFPPLSYVKAEIDGIQATLPGSKGLLDDAFSLDRLQAELAQNVYPIVHLATHGKFGLDARETFLVTGGKARGRREEKGEKGDSVNHDHAIANQPSPAKLEAQTYNEKLTMNALYQMLRTLGQGKMLELLTLTACETAVGSDREALGIAGISLQAGARSTVASLWQVDDQATAQLITGFYQSLKQGMSRAKALQAAQKNWLQQHPGDRHHPGYWAALILIGNWL